jgi:methyl-accepting chemotaxis protein
MAEAAQDNNQGADALARERYLTGLGLAQRDAVSPDIAGLIDQSRAVSSKLLGEVLQRSEALLGAGQTQAQTNLKNALADLVRLRQDIDENLRRPKIDRTVSVINAWQPAATLVIEAASDLRLILSRAGAAADPRLAILEDVVYFAFVTGDYAQREQAGLAGFIATGAAIGPLALKPLIANRERVQFAWERLQFAARSSAHESGFEAKFAAVGQDYFSSFEKLRTKIYEAGSVGDDYPVDAKGWSAQSSASIQTIIDLRKAAEAETRELIGQVLAGQRLRLILFGLMGLISFLAIGLSAWIIATRVIGPINAVSQSMWRLAEGDNSATIAYTDQKNEIGHMARAIRILRDNTIDQRRLQRQEKMQAEELRATAIKVVGAVDAIRDASGAISDSSRDLAIRSERDAAGTQQTAAAITEIALTVQRNADHSANALALADTALIDAGRGAAAVSDVVGAISRIQSTSGRISDIIQIMEEIAFQIKLLALNAAVEAARAGEAGRGFAVVAQEVRSLADRSRQASQQIRQLIADSSREVSQGVSLTDTAAQALHQILATVKNVAAIMPDIAQAGHEQARAISEVKAALVDMEMASQQNATLVEQSAATTAALAAQATLLFDIVRSFVPEGGSLQTAENRRAYARVSCSLPVKIESNGQIANARMINLSLGGAGIAGEFSGRPGNDINIHIDGYEGHIPARCLRIGNDRIGVRFVDLGQHDQGAELLAQIMEDVQHHRTQAASADQTDDWG